MDKYLYVSMKTMENLRDCFSNSEEFSDFVLALNEIVQECYFQGLMINRVNEDARMAVVMRQVTLFTLLCREHIDLIHQLISKFELEKISKDELDKRKD